MHPGGIRTRNPSKRLASDPRLIGVAIFISIADASKIILTTNETSVTVLKLYITVSLCLLCPVRLLWIRENNTTSPPDR